MKDKLRELAERWRCRAEKGDVGGFYLCAAEVMNILDAEGDGGAVDRVEAHKSYDAIDRWLRNNMDDEEYAEYSTELDRVFSYNTHPARSGVVSDEDFRDAERYRWLRDDPPTWLSVRKKTNRDLKSDGNMVYLDSHILDHAIDAAIQGDNGDLHLGAPAWPGQLEGKAPPEGWVQLSVNNLSEPVAQGEVVFTGLHIDGSPRYERATNPHLPDAADSGRVPDVQEKYDELILAVGNKYRGEARHETALRYIKQAEQQSSIPCAAAPSPGDSA